jgi:hypothetical protein
MLTEDLASIYTYNTHVPKRLGANDKVTQHAARFCVAGGDAGGPSCMPGETCTNGECIAGPCVNGEDCGACQSCTSLACASPTPPSPDAGMSCLTTGL